MVKKSLKIPQGQSESVWFSPDTPVSSTNRTDRRHIAEIVLRVALNTITLTPYSTLMTMTYPFLFLLSL
jgi:hypothetical protein